MLLRLREQYIERIWGGQRLATLYAKPIPKDKAIGEAWLVSDHSSHESVVAEGPHAGRTLHELLEKDAAALLGVRAKPTIHGRFPLLLKILDARDKLSVQAHPDDACARELKEPDVGKTEMWHVLHAEPDAELICGLKPKANRETFAESVRDGSVEELLNRFPVEPGDSVFVPSGTVHAICEGIVLAEIQQNSDLTYRVYDWGRLQDDGAPRQLHVAKALKAIHFGSRQGGKAAPLSYQCGGAQRTVLAACRYFAAELIQTSGQLQRNIDGRSFHLLVAKQGSLKVGAGGDETSLSPGEALLVTGSTEMFEAEGGGAFLDYYVPDLRADVLEPLLAVGHSREAIIRLGGSPAKSDLARP